MYFGIVHVMWNKNCLSLKMSIKPYRKLHQKTYIHCDRKAKQEEDCGHACSDECPVLAQTRDAVSNSSNKVLNHSKLRKPTLTAYSQQYNKAPRLSAFLKCCPGTVFILYLDSVKMDSVMMVQYEKEISHRKT